MNRRVLVLGFAGLLLLWVGSVFVFTLWLRTNGLLPLLTQLTFGDFWMNVLKWPTIVLLALLGVGCAHSYDAQRTQKKELTLAAAEHTRLQQEGDAAKSAEALRYRFAAQVVGVQWLNPLQRRDYSTEWQLLWTLGLAKPNADDDVVPKNPEKWSKVRSVGGIAFNMGGETFSGYSHRYITEVFSKLWERYFMDEHYFYSVAKTRNPRREVAGIHVEMTLPPGLDPAESVTYARREIISSYGINKPKYSSTGEPPHLNVHQGGAAAGFTSVEAALDYLEAHPDKTVWVLSFDAPSFPKDEQLNETGALLVLAHPDYVTGREPLAWIQRASRVPVVKGAVVPAWHAALADAANRGALKPADIGYLIHDAGQGDTAASKRLGDLARSATESLPNFDFAKQNFNSAALLGDLRAGTAATNLVLAIAYAHHKNVPVIVAGTRETAAGETTPDDRAVTAVLVRPPANPTPFDPNKNWFRARGEGNAYLPWWSRRHDAEPNRMQGWSD